MVGVICPSVFEYRSLGHSKLRRERMVLIHSGMGKLRALSACHKLIKERPRLKSILLVGFAGGLTPSLKVGDIIEPSVFIEQDYNAEPFEKFPNIIKRNGRRKLIRASSDAAMLTQDKFLKENPYREGPYAKKYPRLACDMESYAVAHFCRASGIPYAVVKLISDSADANADHDFLKACRQLAPKLNETVLEAVHVISRSP